MKSEIEIICMDLSENKGKYIEIAKKKSDLKEKELRGLYSEWTDLYFKYGVALIRNTNALQNSVSALKTLKVDPFIVGGAVNGLVGPVGGLVAGSNAYDRNRRIDQARSEAQKEVNNTIIELSNTKVDFELKTKNLISFICDFPEAAKISEQYQQNIKDEQEKEIKDLLEKYSKGSNTKKQKNTKFKDASLYGFIVSVFVLVTLALCGVGLFKVMFWWLLSFVCAIVFYYMIH